MRVINLLKDFPNGYQFGELFGHGIVVQDFNGDGLGNFSELKSYVKGILLSLNSDDVMVSAPCWSRLIIGQGSKSSNIGRVYYFEQIKSNKGKGNRRTIDDFQSKEN